MDNKWPFSLGIEAKRWFHLESKVTVHLHNSALHQRPMNPIPSHWLWLNTGNGYPFYEGPAKLALASALHLQLSASTSPLIKTKTHTSGHGCSALLQQAYSAKSVWMWHTSTWFKLPKAFLIGRVTWKAQRSQSSLAKRRSLFVLLWTFPLAFSHNFRAIISC